MDRKWYTPLVMVVILVAVLFSHASVCCGGEPTVSEILAKLDKSYDKMRDLQADVKVVFTDQDELRKIGEDFAKSFGFKKFVLSYKPPDKLRYETTHASFAKVVIITRGDTKAVQIPALRINKRTTIPKDEMGKKQYPIDFGIACGDIWTEWKIQLAGVDTVDGASCYHLKLLNPYANKYDSHMEIWIDRSIWVPRRLEKRRWNGELKSRLCFKQFKLVDKSVMIPHRIEIYNIDNKLSGVLEYSKIELNKGISDNSFKVK